MSEHNDKESLKKSFGHLFDAMARGEEFRRDPTIIRSGRGLAVTDIDGRDYIDGLSGIWVTNIGHGNPAVIEAMSEQLQRLSFSWPAGTLNEPALRLAKLLADITPPQLTTVKYMCSGSEATDSALRLVRQYFLQTGQPRRTKILSRYLAWHGSTMGALSMGGTAAWKQPFGPFLGECLQVPPPYCYRCPYGLTYPECDLACARVIERVIEWEGAETVAAVFIDPVMVTAGILVPPEGYLNVVREICDRTGTLLVFDEVITGFGRTGKMFAMDTFGIVPDIVALAKGMAGGYAPLAAVIASRTVADAFWGEEKGFTTGHTFGGNPLSATAGYANITEILDNDLVEQAARVGQYLQGQGQTFYKHKMAGDVRGVGLLWGIELVADRDTRAPFAPDVKPGLMIQAAAKRRGMLMRASPGFVALGPPLISTEADIDRMLEIVDASIDEVQAEVQ